MTIGDRLILPSLKHLYQLSTLTFSRPLDSFSTTTIRRWHKLSKGRSTGADCLGSLTKRSCATQSPLSSTFPINFIVARSSGVVQLQVRLEEEVDAGASKSRRYKIRISERSVERYNFKQHQECAKEIDWCLETSRTGLVLS